jgi:HPt (histidine-containing phosphotransfer) domain-containing protein
MKSVPVELSKFNEMTDGDVEFAFDLAGSYIESGEQALSEVRAALAKLDRPALGRAAHKLKGASANIYAQPMWGAASTLEAQAISVDPNRLQDLVRVLHAEFMTTASFLREYAAPPIAKAG